MAVEVTIKKDAFLLYKLLVDGIASSIDGGEGRKESMKECVEVS